MLAEAEPIIDLLDPARANALYVALGLAARVGAGDPMPPFFHQLYFWDPQPPDALGRDGHPEVGRGIVPDTGLPRRMWAGGALEFKAPVLLGQPAEKRSFCTEVAHKSGRSGPLAFVTLRHEIWQSGQLCTLERQDLVYREDPKPDAVLRPTPQAERKAETRVSVQFDATLLFRYSALTLNGHRIHYDVDYAQDVEGYDGLVVHGPLLAQLLMLNAEQNLAGLNAFAFRGMSPLTLGKPAALCSAGRDYWVEQDGALILQGTAS